LNYYTNDWSGLPLSIGGNGPFAENQVNSLSLFEVPLPKTLINKYWSLRRDNLNADRKTVFCLK